jgi:hypothetical protein
MKTGSQTSHSDTDAPPDLTIIFGVVRLPKVTLDGFWNGKTGETLSDRTDRRGLSESQAEAPIRTRYGDNWGGYGLTPISSFITHHEI